MCVQLIDLVQYLPSNPQETGPLTELTLASLEAKLEQVLNEMATMREKYERIIEKQNLEAQIAAMQAENALQEERTKSMQALQEERTKSQEAAEEPAEEAERALKILEEEKAERKKLQKKVCHDYLIAKAASWGFTSPEWPEGCPETFDEFLTIF